MSPLLRELLFAVDDLKPDFTTEEGKRFALVLMDRLKASKEVGGPLLMPSEHRLVELCAAALAAPDAPVVATGTLPDSVRTACVTDIVYRETLVLEGLYWIWTKNTRK